jgi:fumarate hydratase class II
VADPARAAELLGRSLVTVTALVPTLGYDLAAEIAKEANATGKSPREVLAGRGLLSDAELDAVFDVRRMTEGGLGAGGGE